MKFKLKKPSKRIIILLVCAFTVIGFIVWNKVAHGRQNLETNNIQAISQLSTSNDTSAEDTFSNIDTTDLTGTSDTSTATNTNVSEMVTQNLFANAVDMSNNNSATPDNVNALVNNVVNGVQNSFTYLQYTAKSLPTATNPSKDDMKLYASSFATLQIQLINNLATNTEPAALATIYKEHARSLYKVKTPSDIVDTELQIINNFSEVASAFDAFANEDKDPLKAPLAVKAYQDAGNTQQDLVLQVGKYLDKNGIIDLLDNTSRNYWTLVITQ